MSQVFLSYAHEDAAFVDRLHRDLSEARIPATYDKLALDIGDSIVVKISTIIQESASVIAVVSPASVDSKWVQQELAWALTGQLAGKSVRILPAVLGDCELPALLADRLFADFRREYFPALRALIQSLRRALPPDPANGFPKSVPVRYDSYLQECEQLETALAQRNRDVAFAWLQEHPWVVAALVANPRDVVCVAPSAGQTSEVPTLVCWTLATHYLWHLVALEPVDGAALTTDTLWAAATSLSARAHAYESDIPGFVRACALSEAGGELTGLLGGLHSADMPGTVIEASVPNDHARRAPQVVRDRLILLAGRRHDHSGALLDVRRRARQELGVDIKSYEWVLEALGGKLYRHGEETG